MSSFTLKPEHTVDNGRHEKTEGEQESNEEAEPKEVSSKDILNIWIHHEDQHGRSYFYNSITKKSQWILPEGENDWLECKDEQGKVFYHNAHSDVSIWEHPSTYGSANWIECIDKDSGRTFFYNVRERKSVWTRPDEKAYEKGSPGRGVAESVHRDLQASKNDNKKPPNKETKTTSAGKHDSSEISKTTTKHLYVEESKRSESHSSDSSEPFTVTPAQDGEFHDYVLKEGGGTTMFGRKSWKRRFLVLRNGEIAWFKSFKDYLGGVAPLKERWTSLAGYRMEESLSDPLGIRLIPISVESIDRVWNLRTESGEKKQKLMEAVSPFVVTKGFVKSLERHLSGRRFLTDFQE